MAIGIISRTSRFCRSPSYGCRFYRAGEHRAAKPFQLARGQIDASESREVGRAPGEIRPDVCHAAAMKWLRRLLSHLAAAIAGAIIGLLCVYIAIASNLPELRPWHGALSQSDFGPADYDRDFPSLLD